MRTVCAAVLCLALAGCSAGTASPLPALQAKAPAPAIVAAAQGEVSLEVPELI
ncbi:MAG: hypothetical protein ABR525_04490 [Candidatus Limnocylindria bacterium]